MQDKHPGDMVVKALTAPSAPLLEWHCGEEKLTAFLAGKCPGQQGGDSW